MFDLNSQLRRPVSFQEGEIIAFQTEGGDPADMRRVRKPQFAAMRKRRPISALPTTCPVVAMGDLEIEAHPQACSCWSCRQGVFQFERAEEVSPEISYDTSAPRAQAWRRLSGEELAFFAEATRRREAQVTLAEATRRRELIEAIETRFLRLDDRQRRLARKVA